MKYIQVAFRDYSGDYKGRSYLFKYKGDNAIKEGDLVLCDTAYGASLAKVISVSLYRPETDYTGELREVISVVDVAWFYLQKEKEKIAEDLKRQMEERIEEIKVIDCYRHLSKYDNKLKQLIEEYDKLGLGD